MFLTRTKKKKDNFMLYIPYRNHKAWVEKESKVYLIFTHDKKIERLASWLTSRSQATDIELDKMATTVWKLINNERTVYKIGQDLLETYGQECNPVYSRLIMYLRYLNKKGWIKFRKVDEDSSLN